MQQDMLERIPHLHIGVHVWQTQPVPHNSRCHAYAQASCCHAGRMRMLFTCLLLLLHARAACATAGCSSCCCGRCRLVVAQDAVEKVRQITHHLVTRLQPLLHASHVQE